MALDLLDDVWLPKPTPVQSPTSGLDFEDVTVSSKRGVALSHLHLGVKVGEIFALVGPAGAGKTSAIRAAAGTVRLTTGSIKIDGRDVTERSGLRRMAQRSIGLVAQQDALLPQLRIHENVAFALRGRRAPRGLVRERVAESLRLVGLQHYRDGYPGQLSAAQRLRVALAQALAIRPRVLLLDEPLATLDAQVRRDAVEEFAQLLRSIGGLTVIYATRDPSEALACADRIAVLQGGKLVSFGPAQELCRRPPNRFTAEFLGRANLLEVTIASHARDGQVTVRFGDSEFLVRDHPTLGRGNRGLLCIRPQEIALRAPMEPSNALRCTVLGTARQDDRHEIVLNACGTMIRAAAAPMLLAAQPGQSVDVYFRPAHGVLVPAELRR